MRLLGIVRTNSRICLILLSTVALISFLINMINLTKFEFVVGHASKSKESRQLQSTVLTIRSSEEGTTEKPTHKQEVQHIAFLKVHKAASTTVQNIFLRFGWYRNLTFVLPPAENPAGFPNIISLKEPLTNTNILAPPKGRHFDILCNHVLYTNETFRKFMPKDTVYIGIVREPFEQFRSILNYIKPYYIYDDIRGEFPASEFLRNPSKYEPTRLVDSWTNNRMAIEYGFPPELFAKFNQTEVGLYLNKLNKEFKLILISEYMEESIVLMRRLLNWKVKDIIYLDNKNVFQRKQELLKPFNRVLYKSYAKIDYALYTFFYKKLKEKIRQEGKDFDDELLHFKELRNEIMEYCKQNEQATPIQIEATRWSDAFNFTKLDCVEQNIDEISFIKQIRIRQYGSANI